MMLFGSFGQSLVKLVADRFCSPVRLSDKAFATWTPELKRDLFVHFLHVQYQASRLHSAYGLLAKGTA